MMRTQKKEHVQKTSKRSYGGHEVFELKKAILDPFSDKDVFEKDGCTVAVLPAHEFLAENNYF
jgi:hypothetical protein